MMPMKEEHLASVVNVWVRFYDGHPFGSIVMTLVALIGPLLYYLYNRNLRLWKFRPNQWGSFQVERGVRCNKRVKDGQLIEGLDHKIKGEGLVKTIYDCFMHGYEASNDGRCLGRLVDNLTRYEWFKYSEVIQQGTLIGKFLRARGLKRQESVGLYAANCCEWLIAQFGCVTQSIISVPLYDTLGIESIRHSINETEMPAIFCDCEEKLKQILSDRKHFPALRLFVMVHDQVKDATLPEKCKAQGIEFLTWSQAKAEGAKHAEIEKDLPSPDDIFLIQYTSGTTGIAKGAILSHKNMVSTIGGGAGVIRYTSPKGTDQSMNENDCGFVYLPLAHVYGQTSAIWVISAGGGVGISSGNILRFAKDCQLLKPTYIPLVPRIMNRIYTKVVDETKSGLKGWLFWKCYARKKALYNRCIWTRSSIYDWLVFKKVQAMLGGNVRLMTTGSAPIATEVLEFWRIVFGALVVEAYGQTESGGVTTTAASIVGGQVGHTSMSCYLRLLDLPELGYTNDHTPPQGEICLKGANVMSGYFKQPDLTKESFTPDGYLLTGDIGEFLPDGSLRIIDRRKHIFKLSQGEYIAPEKIESIYIQCPLVAQVFIDGNSMQTYTVAIIVPSEKEGRDWATAHDAPSSLSSLCSNKDFQLHVLHELIVLGKEKGLNSLEQIRSLYLHSEMFSVENGLLTPSLKNKRDILRRHFQAKIAAIYEAGPMLTPAKHHEHGLNGHDQPFHS